VAELDRAIQERFGHAPRPAQRALIERSLTGQSSLGIMPTGAGKSLTFQASAALLDGTVLVVSPLLSLMRDQVERLSGGAGASTEAEGGGSSTGSERTEALRAARLDSTLDRAETNEVLRRLGRGDLDLLYVAPERLANERFRAALGRARVALLAVDEAHCISAWGHDFRPDYLRLPILREEIGRPPVLALTATAPPAVQADIQRGLEIPPDGVVNTGARRPNLALRVEAPPDREARLVELVTRESTAPTIVYAFRQADTEWLANRLREAGVDAAAYHAGLDDEVRADVQDRFLRDDLACVVATIAFGMGVDKPNVRRVFHAHAPRSLEGYWQEIGRAGRDGAPAEIALLYAEGDLWALGNFADARALTDEQVRGALNRAFTSKESADPSTGSGQDVIAFSPGAVGDEHDLEPAALRTLLARLELRGVVRALTPAWDTYQLPLSTDHEAIAGALGAADGDVWRELVTAGKAGRTWLTLNLSEAARAAGLHLERVRAVLRRVEEDGLAEPRTAGVLQRYQVLRQPDRATDTPALLTAVAEALEGEHRRLASVRSYVLERTCRVSHGLTYLGDADPSACGICDLCQGQPPIAESDLRAPDWRARFDPAEVRAMAALNDGGPDPVGVARALCQITSPRSRAYRRHAGWGRLERAPYVEVLAAVREVLGG
jgi:ATP-dependent DNA helicase RecQ